MRIRLDSREPFDLFFVGCCKNEAQAQSVLLQTPSSSETAVSLGEFESLFYQNKCIQYL